MNEEKFNPPKDSKEILDRISSLTFKQRLQFGADIGRKCENANELIKQLRDNPPPVVPNVDLDEGLCEILAPQQRNVSKYYHHHQIALTAAVSTKTNVALLRDEIKSQSKFFKKYVIKHYIKQCSDDAEIVALVKSVPPSVQKKIIHCLIKEKRAAALDVLCEEMRKIAGVDYILDFLHGCSSKKVRASLDFKNIFQHKALRWDKLFRFHQEMIVQMIADQLQHATLTWGKYNAIYNIWRKRDKKSAYKKNRLNAWEEMLQTGTYQSAALWKLTLKYPHAVIDPCLTYKEKREFEKEIAANGHEVKTFNDIRIKKIVPDFIRDRFNYFTRRNPQLFLEFIRDTTVINLRGVLRHSIPGKLWCQKDFKPQYIFEILNIAKAKSNRKLFWPYHELVTRRNMSRWQYNIYTQSVEDVCQLQYGSKLKNKVGFDHLLLCQITRAKTKKSVFYSFSPRQMTQLINYVYDWMEEMTPKGTEDELYDRLGSNELTHQWTVNWLSKLYTKRNKKEGTNRYDECITLLTDRWLKLWDTFTTNAWRKSFAKRMTTLEELVRDVYDAYVFWQKKCDHETRKEPTSREVQFAKTINNLVDKLQRDGSSYNHGNANIKQLADGVKSFMSQFKGYRNQIHITPATKSLSYYSRSWPLRSSLNSLYSLITRFITQETHAQHAYDYFVSFHVMRNVRKIRSKTRYDVLKNLLKILYDRRPVYYVLKANDSVLRKTSDITSIHRQRLSDWLTLYEQILSEIWDEALNKKRVMSEYGWPLAKSSMDEYMKAYQFIIKQNVTVSTDISHWFYSRSDMQRYGFFRAGGKNNSFAKKPFKSPSIVRSILEYIRNRRINRSDTQNIIPLKLIHEMYEYYQEMCKKIKPPSSRHRLYKTWVGIIEKSQRLLIEELQDYLSHKQRLIDQWDREPESKEDDDDDIDMNVDAIVEPASVAPASVAPGFRPSRGSMRGRPAKGRGRLPRDRGRGRGRGRTSKRPKHFIEPKVDRAKAAKRKQRLMRSIVITGRQNKRFTREGAEFVGKLLPNLFSELLEFYQTPARMNWNDDRQSFERIHGVIKSWYDHIPHRKAKDVAKRWNASDRTQNKLLNDLYSDIQCEIAPKAEAKLLSYASSLGHTECKTAEAAMKVKLPQIHADNETLIHKLQNAAYNRWENHINECADRDRKWLNDMMSIADLFEKYKYDYIYRIFKEFVPVFEVTQFWGTDKKNKVFYNLIAYWRSRHFSTMHSFAQLLTRTVNMLDATRKTKIDILKQIRHKKTVKEDSTAMDVDDVNKDGTFETMEITRINSWISEIIIKCFDLEFRTDVKWEPELLELFRDILVYAPNEDFSDLFGKLSKFIIDEMKSGDDSLLWLLISRLKSKMRCSHDENWNTLWECFISMRSKLENKFDEYCCDIMVNKHTSTKQREIMFAQVATEDHLKILCNQRPAVFVKLFGALCDFPNRTSDESRALANGFLDYFLAEDEHNASPDTKDQLLRYLDVRDHKIRKRLAKLTDSNSVDEREAGYRTLITATLLVNNRERDVQIKRTVKFFMTKLKNEAIDRREMGLEILFGELKSQNSLILESDDCLKYLSEMLQDCLEVQDLDKGEDNKEWDNIHEHRILRHFLQLSVDAIELAAKSDLDGSLFEFGVDLQWRMCVFRKGNTEAAVEYRINLGPKLLKRHAKLKAYLEHMEKYGTEEGHTFEGIFFYPDEEDLFVEKYMHAYESRTKIHYPEYLDSSVSATSFMENLFLVLGSNWHKSTVLQNLLQQLITDYESLDLVLDEESDDNQLEEAAKNIEAATAKIICYIVQFNKHKWIDIKVMARFVKALFGAFKTLHSAGYDDILQHTQKTLIFMLDALLYEYTKNEKARKAYKDDWANHEILKLLLDECMNMLSVQYPQKANGRFWRMQWELHKIFRSRMMHCDQDIETILHVEDVNELPTFKWTLFGNYWRVCLEGLKYAINMSEVEYKKKADGMDIDEDEEKATELDIAKEKKGHKERVISLFRNDEEKDIWRLELAVWCVDIAMQWIWGGDWLEIAQSPCALLIQDSVTWKGFMIIPTQTLFSTISKPLLRFRWNECNIIRDVMTQVLRSLTIIQEQDIERLRVFEKEHPAVVIFEKLITKYHCNRSRNIKMKKDFAKLWFEVDLIKQYMSVVMHSRQIKVALWRWWAHNSTNTIIKQNGRKQVKKYVKSVKKRTNAINELLEITKSAIYLRFVWRHLLQYNQQKLNSFLESGSCFRGVFYLKPDDRTYTRKQQRDRESRKAQMAARFAEADTKTDRVLGPSGALKKAEITKRDQRRGGGKEATRRILSVQDAGRSKADKVEVELSAHDQVKKEFEEQKRFEAALEEWKDKEDKDEDILFDHRDIWCFEGCYQLNRLLPNQLDEIGARHVAAAMNPNRGMPERVKSIIRWTLLPTTTYGDIVEFFNKHESDKLPINLLEALMKGVMENDEVLAPMHYLLQPKFLSSQQARIAAFAITKCVPHIPRRQYTNLLRAVLSGKRRNALKITAYKQIIRMLIERPSRMHIQMVVHEWDRNEVHRDVRIVILQAAFDFIRRAKPISYGSDAAWHIFETAVTHPTIRKNIEIMTALMGCTIEGEERNDDLYKGLVLKPRLLDHLQCFKETPIPKKHAARWAKIIVVLCDRVYTEYEEKKEEGDDTKEDKDEDEDIDIIEGDQHTEEKEKMEVEEEKEEEDDGKGPYLKNEGKPRCLDDIAYIAMRSLETWTKYNDSITRDALRIVGETIADFNPDFIANENEDIHTVNWNRFEMACDILKKTLKLNQSNIRFAYAGIITDIVARFDAIINSSLQRFEDVYDYGESSTYTISDPFAQSRDYIRRVRKRLYKFFDLMGSFQRIPIEYYKSLIAPLDSGDSRGMYTDIVMKKRWEMLSNSATRNSTQYYGLCVDYIQDLMYYGCIDSNFAVKEVMNNANNILNTISRDSKSKILKILIKDTFPLRNQSLYLPAILSSPSFTHLRHCLIKYMMTHSLFDVETIRFMPGGDGERVFCAYFKSRMQMLLDCMSGPSLISLWRNEGLNHDRIDTELNDWFIFFTAHCYVSHNHKKDATLHYPALSNMFYNQIICLRVNHLMDKDAVLTAQDWLHCKLFHRLCKSNMNILVVLYNYDLIALLRMPIFLAEKQFVQHYKNPFVSDGLTVSCVLDQVWNHITSSYFYEDWDTRRYSLISKIFSWLLSPQYKLRSFRNNVVATALHCLKQRTYQPKAWGLTKNRLLKVFDMITKEKCTIYADDDDDDAKTSMEKDPVLLGAVAIQMHSLITHLLSYASTEKVVSYVPFEPLFNEILSRSQDKNNKVRRVMNQRILLRLLVNDTYRTVFLLHNKLQKVFDLAIEFTVNPPLDGKGGLSWSNIAELIEQICVELSPRWHSNNKLNQRATSLIQGLFKAFINSPLQVISDLDPKLKVYRNICIYLLRHKVHLIQCGLGHKLSSALKYLIDLNQAHLNATKRNPNNVCFNDASNVHISRILQSHFERLNSTHRFTKTRSVDPICGALICQIYKDAANKKAKNHTICGEICYEFMNRIPKLITQAIFSNDLVKMVSWSVDHATKYKKSVANITHFIELSSNYLSPTFNTKRIMLPLARKYYKLLVNDYCDWSQGNIYSARTATMTQILSKMINNAQSLRWLIFAAAQESMNLIFALSIRYSICDLNSSVTTQLIMKYIAMIESESRSKYWNRINIDCYSNYTNYTGGTFGYDDDDQKMPAKKTKLAVSEIYKRSQDLMPETLQIIHKIFGKELIAPMPLKTETQNAIYNEYIVSLMTAIMKKYSGRLMKSQHLEISSTFIVSFVSHICDTPLRYKDALKSKLISNFLSVVVKDKEEKAPHIMKWVQWMLKYRNDMNKAARDILTRLSLSLVVHFGHESCKKSKRVEYELILLENEKEKQKQKENKRKEKEKKRKEKEKKQTEKVKSKTSKTITARNIFDDDSDEHEVDDPMDVTSSDSVSARGMFETDSDDTSTESVASFESEADDVLTWKPEWIELLNEFSNDENAKIRMTTRRVKTVFVDWEEHKTATTSWVKSIVDNNE